MDSKWQLRVAEQMMHGAIEIFIFREVAGGRLEYITNLSGPHGMEAKTVPRGERMDACMTLNWNDQGLLQAFSDGLFDFGIKPTQEPVLKNELTATKFHLSDMRDMVCIMAGIKKGEDLGKDSKYGENRSTIAQRPGDEPPKKT